MFWGNYYHGRRIIDVFLPGDEEVFGEYIRKRIWKPRNNLDSGFFRPMEDDDYMLIQLKRAWIRHEKRNRNQRSDGLVELELDNRDSS